jgi:tricorn protease
VVYAIGEDGRRLTRVTAGQPPNEGGEGGPGGGGGFGGGIADLNISRDGRTLYFRERDGHLRSAAARRQSRGSSSASAATTAAAGQLVKLVAVASISTFGVRIDRPLSGPRCSMMAWRTMKYRFYDPNMHGMDWDAAREKYRPLVDFVGDRQELLNIINEMIGELNASHTGAAPPPRGPAGGGVSTANLGLELEPDTAAGRYRVAYIYDDGPADKDWVRVKVGDYLLAIDGKPVKAGDEYWQLLNQRLNRKVNVTFNSKPADDGAWNTRIEAISTGAYSQLRYERWVKERRKKVDEMSGGRIGYLHIQAMNPPSLRRFEKELREYRNKEAMIIDQRWNGGGNIEQELLAILVQRQYQIWQPARHRSYGPSVRRVLWTKGRLAKLAFGFKRGDVSGGVPRARARKGDWHADDGCGDRNRQLQLDRWFNCAHAGCRCVSRRREAYEHGKLWRATGHARRQQTRGRPGGTRSSTRSGDRGVDEATERLAKERCDGRTEISHG